MATSYVQADSNTVLLSALNDTTGYFRLSKRRQISPECIIGFSMQITFEISLRKTVEHMGKLPLRNIGKKVRKLRRSSAMTEHKWCAICR